MNGGEVIAEDIAAEDFCGRVMVTVESSARGFKAVEAGTRPKPECAAAILVDATHGVVA